MVAFLYLFITSSFAFICISNSVSLFIINYFNFFALLFLLKDLKIIAICKILKIDYEDLKDCI